jgi:preprotein translocase subunit SecA
MKNIITRLIGTKHDRTMKRMRPLVARIGELEPASQKATDDELRARIADCRRRHDKGESLDDLLPEVFATVREAGRRRLGMRHFDVQLIGGVVLHQGRIAEMKTGEGKTLVATLPLVLNALSGKGGHLVTVNDYLASRDAEWMGQIYRYLGLSVGVVTHGQSDAQKRRAYGCDITYGQNNEFGFDYLRDNMKFSIYDYMQRDPHYAIVDEVDSILVDEARTPLIISGAPEDSTDLYRQVNELIPRMRRDLHYTVDEGHRNALLTDEGVSVAERFLGVHNLYDPENLELLHHVNQALKAHTLYKRDRDYMISDGGEVLIIDEDTGRVLPGRRWSDGLHQAVEAKEHVRIREEHRTLATISFQNYFRLYDRLAGMTGTADTEAAEFKKIYELDVVVIPTNQECIRIDHQDVVYKTEREKFTKIVEEILDCHERGQPALVGTVSVEKSEAISRILKRRRIPHNVLNAKQHEREAYVVAQAGRKGSVTVATNMAGRGTDIVLGGNPEMLAKMKFNPEEDPPERFDELVEEYRAIQQQEREHVIQQGGVHIVGTERHESRRIDNQLRGRSGRQGDPGSSRFFLSLEDDLLRIFGAEKLTGLMDRLGMEEGVPIEHKMVTKSIENAQKKVEARNFEMRKNLLEYDDVMNQQRKTIYTYRRQVLEGKYEPASLIAEEEARKLRRKGKAVTVSTGEEVVREVDPRITERIVPILEFMVRRFGRRKGEERGRDIETEALLDAPAEQETRLLELDEIEELDVQTLEFEAYHIFGVPAHIDRLASDPRRALEILKEKVPQSIMAQRERLLDMCESLVGGLVNEYTLSISANPEQWDLESLAEAVRDQFAVELESLDSAKGVEDLEDAIFSTVEKRIEEKEQEMTLELFLRVFRHYTLQTIDRQWIEHLQNVDYLRKGIGLRGYASRDPKQEYKKEGYRMFEEMMTQIEENTLKRLFRVRLAKREDALKLGHRRGRVVEGRGGSAEASRGAAAAPTRPKEDGGRKVGRNDPCPCGSGKKYKKCCMAKDMAAAGG